MSRVSSPRTLSRPGVDQSPTYPVYLIDESIEPTRLIIAYLNSLRDSPGDNVQEERDIISMPESDEQPDYPSESEGEAVEMVDIYNPPLPGS